MSDQPAAGWEGRRRWDLLRRFVYYLVEDFVPPDWATGARAVDFSGGLGDLAAHLSAAGADRVTVTVPEVGRPRPPGLDGSVEWIDGVPATEIAERLPAGSVDLFCARMVFQFPTWEGDRADPDLMLAHIAEVLAPGGLVVVAVHDFFALHPPGVGHTHGLDEHLAAVEAVAAAMLEAGGPATAEARRLSGLVEMVRFLGLPPREGPLGETGFGLKVPMLAESMLRAGLTLEHAEHIEPFTFPPGIPARAGTDPDGVAELGNRVWAVKRAAFAGTEVDSYARPGLIRRVVEQVAEVVPVVTVPIVRLSARKPG